MVQWTPEKDQQLLRGVLQLCEIKLSGRLLQDLADLIGEGCTPKAINHRLFNIKKAGKSINNPSATPTKPNLSTSTKSTPATASSRNRNHDKNEREGEPDADGELTNDLVSPTPKKRGRPTKAESEARKKVKVEHVKPKPSSPNADKSDGELDEI